MMGEINLQESEYYLDLVHSIRAEEWASLPDIYCDLTLEEAMSLLKGIVENRKKKRR